MGSCVSTSRFSRKDDASEKRGISCASVKSKWRKLRGIKFVSAKAIGDKLEVDHRPIREIVNGTSRIGNACLHTQQGKKGVNQDAMLVWENFSSRDDTIFCGVFDGHGPFGHMVSKKVRDSLPNLLSNIWKLNPTGHQIPPNSNGNASPDHPDSTENHPLDERLPEIYHSLKEAMFAASKQMDDELKSHPTIDCFCSGTTAVTVIKQNLDLVISNVGDSRAVLGTRDANNALVPLQLTVDLKPDLPSLYLNNPKYPHEKTQNLRFTEEAARIQKCKGRVFALQDEPEVARVWLPHSDSPGLAMARAFGDFCLKDYGLISLPEIYYHKINSRDEFVILATDGVTILWVPYQSFNDLIDQVWDALSNKEAVDVVASAPSRNHAARALVDCAVRAWRLKFPTSKNDDCAVVCLFLNDVGSGAGKDCGEALLGDQSSDEIVLVEDGLGSGSGSTRQQTLAECIAAPHEEWSALEGVTRVNTLLSLPRLLSRKRRG